VAGTDAKAAAGIDAKPPAPGAGLDAAFRDLVPEQYRPQVDAVAKAVGPLRAFLTRHASSRDRETFTGLASRMGRIVNGDELWVLAPAFVTTELREAFAIAVLVFLPFLVIDLVVGLGLAALGLSSTSPQVIALPFKLLLFVSVDGWRLLLDALIRGYV
jgi:flagellar biosynthesis protein FliP